MRLVRSRSEAMIGGVCAGLGKALQVDPSLIRLAFVLVAFADGIGVLIYLAMWVILPSEDDVPSGAGAAPTERPVDYGSRAAYFIGGALILIGGVFLLKNLGWWWSIRLHLEQFWPVLLILAGIALLWRNLRGSAR